MCTVSSVATTFKEPGFFHLHEIQLSLRENEFEITDRKKATCFKYADIEAFSAITVANYFNGTPQGLAHHLKLWRSSADEPAAFLLQQFPEKIKRPKILGVTVPFSATHTNPANDAVYDELIERISYRISRKMLERVERLGRSPWVPNVNLTRDGIEFFQEGKNTMQCRFSEISSTELSDGMWNLRANSESLNELQIPVATMNFLPGLKLFGVLAAYSS